MAIGCDPLSNPSELIRVFEPLTANMTLRTGANFKNFISYRSLGISRGDNAPNGTFRLCDDRGQNESFNVVVNTTGRVRSEKGGGACPF